MPEPESQALYERYRELADRETRERRVYFCGRLATYRYINMDEAIGGALAMFETMRRDLGGGTLLEDAESP